MISVVFGIEDGLTMGESIGVSGLSQAVLTLASYS